MSVKLFCWLEYLIQKSRTSLSNRSQFVDICVVCLVYHGEKVEYEIHISRGCTELQLFFVFCLTLPYVMCFFLEHLDINYINVMKSSENRDSVTRWMILLYCTLNHNLQTPLLKISARSEKYMKLDTL